MDATVDKHLAELYPEHAAALCRRYGEAAAAGDVDAIVVGAGHPVMRPFDDQAYPFAANPHLVQWLPLTGHPGACLVFEPGRKPRVIVCQTDDYWHLAAPLPEAPWADCFDWTIAQSDAEARAALAGLPPRTAYIGDPAQWPHPAGDPRNNPAAVIDCLHYHRPNRTRYEIECIRRATARAIPAHRAAESAFRDGAHEFDIWLAFLAGARQSADALPYPAIIAKNRHAAVLHYQHYATYKAPNDSLLIDAGCAAHGYASDITRTWSTDPEFAAMIADLDGAQRAIADAVRPGQPFTELHARAHAAIAQLLHQWRLVRGDPEHFVERGITDAFFPHGLGHYLGVQVHEPGGTLANPAGDHCARPARYPHLRLLRTLETNQALTIEPGVYFIDSLLAQLRASGAGADVAWERVDRLRRFGGIRIEDDVVVTGSGVENLTRAAFAAAQG